MEYIQLIEDNYIDFKSNENQINQFIKISIFITKYLKLTPIDLKDTFLNTNEIAFEPLYALYNCLNLIKYLIDNKENTLHIKDLECNIIIIPILSKLAHFYDIKIIYDYENYDDTALDFILTAENYIII